MLASLNTLTDDRAIQGLSGILREGWENDRILATEPAIARVVAVDQYETERTLYICRATPLTGRKDQASYRPPLGRLASLPIGKSLTLPNGTRYRLLGKARLHPIQTERQWDSKENIIETEQLGPLTIESLRTLLKRVAETLPLEDLVEQLLLKDKQRQNVQEGIRRSVIKKMALRDQPILDQFQDEIFRLPLGSAVLLLGPAGTGKTTTLIHRLGQKLQQEFLDETEKARIARAFDLTRAPHGESWLMFTPTELLKRYLKEAFAREGVPASDQRIKTWNDYRRDLGRNVFGVLRTPNGTGSFVLKDSSGILAESALERPQHWFSEFDQWQRTLYVENLRKSPQRLAESQAPAAREIGLKLNSVVHQSKQDSLPDLFAALATLMPEVQTLVSDLKEETDRAIRGALNVQMHKNKRFVEDFARFLETLEEEPEVDEDLEDLEADDDEQNVAKAGRSAASAVAVYMRAVRRHARSTAAGRNLKRNSRTVRIMGWVGDRGLTEQDSHSVGKSLLVQAGARPFLNPVKRYLDGIARRYRTFRRTYLGRSAWFAAKELSPSDLDPLELDMILLAILSGTKELLSSSAVSDNLDLTVWSPLRSAADLLKNQIMVDEATDFSPIQLACMAALSHPRINSFFACGDFNQRLTVWGSRSINQLKETIHIEERTVAIAYRQTRQLSEFGRLIIESSSGDTQRITLPEHVDSEGVLPVLLENAPNLMNSVPWLAERIREIERQVNQMPSIAVFVGDEAEVEPLASSLNTALANDNIQAIPCLKGQTVGQDNDIRVFDIQHIKGLEFEAVFFIGVDRLARLHPGLYDKYLYVGTSRAATYLGITCDSSLPEPLAPLRRMLIPDWSSSKFEDSDGRRNPKSEGPPS